MSFMVTFAATVAIALASPAMAANSGAKIPQQFIGSWCRVSDEADTKQATYKRGKNCGGDTDPVKIDRTGILLGYEAGCRFLQVSPARGGRALREGILRVR
jgi:hypothetical protein